EIPGMGASFDAHPCGIFVAGIPVWDCAGSLRFLGTAIDRWQQQLQGPRPCFVVMGAAPAICTRRSPIWNILLHSALSISFVSGEIAQDIAKRCSKSATGECKLLMFGRRRALCAGKAIPFTNGTIFPPYPAAKDQAA